MTGNDQTLVARAQKGERAAFQQLLELHYATMFRIAYRFTGRIHDAEDIAQETCLALANKLQSFRGDSGFSTWLYRIVLNACRDMQKKQTLHRSFDRHYLELEHNNYADGQEKNHKVAWLYRTIAALEPSLKDTALLVLTEDLNHAEAGKVLGCAESTVSWRMLEIRKRLKAAMDRYHD